MAPWRSNVFKLAVIAMSSMPQYDCDPFSDPATRLATCLERAIKAQAGSRAMVHASCDIKIVGRYIVVLHPAGELSRDELVQAGLPDALVPELRAMRLRGSPAIYVIAADKTVTGFGAGRSVMSSRTSAQSTFVQINTLMVVTKNAQPVAVAVGGSPTVRVIERVR
jgi:hypothetical protein